jgi:hypothetical protein
VDLFGFPGASITGLAVSECSFIPVNTSVGELLLDVTDPNRFIDTGFRLHAQPVIPRLDVLGRVFRVMVVIALSPSGLQLTNALEVTIGF